VADPDEKGRNKLQKETGAKKSYSDWRELIEIDKPDVICICSRLPSRHTEVVIEAAKVGCHVYCEKPFAENLEDADKMLEAAVLGNILISVAHLGRYAPMYRIAKELIQKGFIGRPLSIFCRGKEDKRGGGEDMMVLGTHLFDLSRFFFGDPKWIFGHVTVGGREMTLADISIPTEDIGPVAGDEIVALFGFSEGVRGYFESRRGLFDGHEKRMGICVVGSERILSLRFDGKPWIYISRKKYSVGRTIEFEKIYTPSRLEVSGADPLVLDENSSEQDFPFAYCNRYAAVDLLCAITEKRQPISSGYDGRWALEMIMGVYLSHLSGRALKLPLLERKHPLYRQ